MTAVIAPPMGESLSDFTPARGSRVREAALPVIKPWDSVVMAKPGLNTADEARILEDEGLAFRPDVLVLGHVLNDAETLDSTERRRATDRTERERQKAGGWWRRSALFRFAWNQVSATLENQARVRNYQALFAADAPDLDWTHLVVDGAADEHPNEIAHRIAAEAVAEAIDRLLAGPRPDSDREG